MAARDGSSRDGDEESSKAADRGAAGDPLTAAQWNLPLVDDLRSSGQLTHADTEQTIDTLRLSGELAQTVGDVPMDRSMENITCSELAKTVGDLPRRLDLASASSEGDAKEACTSPPPSMPEKFETPSGLQIKRTELKKIKDAFDLPDLAAALSRVEEHAEARYDRNYLADMIILKEMNVALRKQVEDLKAKLQMRTQLLTRKSHECNIWRSKAVEQESSEREIEKYKAERERATAKIILLECQLRDVMQQLHEERVLSSRAMEGIAYAPIRRQLPPPKPVYVAACSASLSAVVVTVAGIRASDWVQRTLLATKLSPSLVSGALATLALTRACLKPKPPLTRSRGCNTDVAVTQHGFYLPIEEHPRGQELLRTLKERDAEIGGLRRDVAAAVSAPSESKIAELREALAARDKQIHQIQEERLAACKVASSKIAALQGRVDSLHTMLMGVCQELITARHREGELGQRSKPMAIPIPIADQLPQATPTFTDSKKTSSSMTPPKSDRASSPEDVFIEGTAASEPA